MVGVFVNKAHAHSLITMNHTFVASHRYIRYIELAKAAQKVGVTLYFFTSNRVSFEKKYVLGIYYNNREKLWQEKQYPLPHLLYDRGGGAGKKPKSVIRKFKEIGINNINSQHFFDKWDLYARLSTLDRISLHLPVTLRGNSALSVVKMLNKYGQVYVKSRTGSCGKGVIRIEKTRPGLLKYYYSNSGKLFSKEFTEQRLINIINQFLTNKPFIIQKPINLIKKDHCIIDFRSEVQKNANGQIIVTGTTARISKPGSPIASNTYQENYYPLGQFMKGTMKLNSLKADALQKKINSFLKSIFIAVEQVYGSFGEMGIDFGIDANGHLWLIECNSKSAKVALYNAYGRQKVRQSFCDLLLYAKYLINKKHNNVSQKEGA